MKKKAKASPVAALSIQHLEWLRETYKDKNWHIDDSFGSEFEDFCEMLTYLDTRQRELVLELTQNFLKVGIDDYMKLFMRALDSLTEFGRITSRNHLVIFPLLPENDMGKSKSSTFLYYQIKSHITKLQEKYSSYKISISETLDFTNNPRNITDKTLLCPIDDFIGTGETAIDAMTYLVKKGVDINIVAIVALVGQKQGIQKLKSLGYNIVVAEERCKGISDLGDSVGEKRTIMESIENRLDVSDKYKFGYGQSEALVKMERTPNNTFPIYWFPKSKYIPTVPFPRG